MARYFQVVTPEPLVIGTIKLTASASSYYNGQVAALTNASGTPNLVKSGTGYTTLGLFYNYNGSADEMTDLLNLSDEQRIDHMAGKYVGVVTGQFEAHLSADYFNAAPTVNAPIYDAEDGTLTTVATGHNAVGVCLGTSTSGDATVYRVLFNFQANVGANS